MVYPEQGIGFGKQGEKSTLCLRRWKTEDPGVGTIIYDIQHIILMVYKY